MFHLKKDQDFYTFILKKIDIHSNFINNNKKLIETQFFLKLITKMFQSFFIYQKLFIVWFY